MPDFKKTLPYLWLVTLFIVLLPNSTKSQTIDASLRGLIMDHSGAAISGVRVTAIRLSTGSKRTVTSNDSGVYEIPALQPGAYSIQAEKKGFRLSVITGIDLTVGDNLVRDLTMEIGSVDQVISIIAGERQLDTSDATVATVVDHEFIENMPLNGKDLTTLFELSPGTILNAGGNESGGGGFSVDGQRPTANNLTIDGASGNAYVPVGSSSFNTTGASIATSASGGTTGILPIDAIEEYRMDTSTYTAENGRTPGGQIQVRTKSGTNQFHGTLFENFRNQDLDDTDWFVKYDDLLQTPLRMNDFGGTVGGPVMLPHLFDGRNKLFFFIAHDSLLLDQPNTTTNSEVPDGSVSEGVYSTFKSFLSVFPAGNAGADPSNPGFDFFDASYPYLIRNHSTSLRIDAQLAHSIHPFFRANIAPSSSYLPSFYGSGSKINIYTYTGGVTVPLNGRLVNEFTINKTSNDTQQTSFIGSVGGNDPSGIANNLPDGVNLTSMLVEYEVGADSGKGAFAYAQDGPNDLNSLSQWNVVDAISLQLKNHLLKFGEDFLTHVSQIHAYEEAFSIQNLLPSTPPYTNLDSGVIDQLGYTQNNAQPDIKIKAFSLFANDDWRVTHNLRLNIGLRWELDPAPTVGPLGVLAVQGTSLSPSTIQASISSKALYVTRYSNFAPRFGFAWSPTGGMFSGTVVRGGVGIYFDTGQAATVAQASEQGYPYQSTGVVHDVAYSSTNFLSLASTGSLEKLPKSDVYLVNPNLVLPRTYEWSLTVERLFGKYTKLSTSYVGNDGEKLVGNDQYLNAITNGAFPLGTSLVSPFGNLFILNNRSHSNYQALQAQLTSRMGTHWSALASYTWSHAEDNGETDFSSVGTLASSPIANSSNDIRQIFAGAIHYAPTTASANHLIRDLMDGWAIDTIARLQTAAPFTVTVTDANPTSFSANADVISGVPTVLHEHVDRYGKVVPGNVLLNWAAFTSPPTSAGDLLAQGNSPTNGYRLFGLYQWDLALSRTLKVWKTVNLDFRVDAFNVINTANFSNIEAAWNTTDASTFGRAQNTYASTYGTTPSNYGANGSQLSVFQNGGPREVQLSLKLRF